MNLQEALRAIHRAAQPFQGGTQVTSENVEESVNEMLLLIDLIQMAQNKGATGYEIERAVKGDFIGHSFT